MKENENFNQYVESYKKLPLQEKKAIVNAEIKKLLAFIEKAKMDVNAKGEILFNREILDLNNEIVSDDDFVEAMFVYIHAIQESLGEYFNEIAKYLYK
jgi:hypothetical protein